MKQKSTKIVIGLLVLIILGIFIYLWFLVTVWAIAFIVTIVAVAIIVLALFKLKEWFKSKKRNQDILRRDSRTGMASRNENY